MGHAEAAEAIAKSSVDIESKARDVMRAHKRAERAARYAARSMAEFAELLESLGIKFEITGGQSQHGRDQDSREEDR